MNLSELGQTFKHARLAANKTQQEIAALSGTTASRIGQFESGQLPGLGIVRVLGLLDIVGLNIVVRPVGHSRTLEDVLAEQNTPSTSTADSRQRARRPRPKSKSLVGR